MYSNNGNKEDNWFDSKSCRRCNFRYVNMNFGGGEPICDVCQEKQEKAREAIERANKKCDNCSLKKAEVRGVMIDDSCYPLQRKHGDYCQLCFEVFCIKEEVKEDEILREKTPIKTSKKGKQKKIKRRPQEKVSDIEKSVIVESKPVEEPTPITNINITPLCQSCEEYLNNLKTASWETTKIRCEEEAKYCYH